jgi:hypothetical protein
MSTSLLLALTPLAVLMIVLLLGYVGCSSFGTAQTDTGPPPAPPPPAPQPPAYTPAIMREASLVAYWRLGEPASIAVPSVGTAIDQKGAHNGNYNKVIINADDKRHSPGAPGNIGVGVTPGILETSPPDKCIEVNGGYVEIPFDSNLNASPFTFEAWVVPEFGSDKQGNYYCLVESSAPIGGGQKKFGWGLYAGPGDPSKVNQPYQWQVWMGNGTGFVKAGVAIDNVKFNQLTYLALTFDPGAASNNLILYLYYPGTGQDLSANSIAPLQATVTGFRPNNNPGGGNFLIGIGRNLFPGVAVDPVPLQPLLYPFHGKIQEVAFYNTALSAANSLFYHEQAGAGI